LARILENGRWKKSINKRKKELQNRMGETVDLTDVGVGGVGPISISW
jgi:hypothetical protein